MIITSRTFEEVRNLIKQAKDKKEQIIFTSDDDELARKVLEKEKIDVLLINLENRRDFQKQRNSGFNQVIANLAKEKAVTIGINLDEIIESQRKAELLARLKQNIKICNKKKLKMKFIAQKEQNKRDKYDLTSLGLTLGMPTSMTKDL